MLHLSYIFCCCPPKTTVYRLNSKTLALVHLIPSWLVWAKIECTVHDALPKWPINRFQPVWQIRQQAIRAYCPSIDTVPKTLHTNPEQEFAVAEEGQCITKSMQI